MGGGKKQTIGYRYFMGLHMAICQGPVDSIEQIFVGKRSLEITDVTSSQTLLVDQKNLFGGDTKEGGIFGNLDVELGEGGQAVNPYLSNILGAGTVPAFLGTTCVVFRAGPTGSGVYVGGSGGGYLAAMSPYPKPWAFQILDIPGGGFNPTKQIVNGTANGGHIIYDCITSIDWGMGASSSTIDTASFTAVTDALFAEGFGLSFTYAQQSSMEDFIGQVLTHIDGVLYTSRTTGKHVLKLVRDDYDVGTLPTLDETNIASLVSFERPAFAEMVNEIVLNYRLSDAFDDSTVTVQDLAAFQAQGALVSQTVDFSGIDNAAMAARIAQRELKQSSTPLARATIVANREAWNMNPADVFKFSWAEYGIISMVLRVIAVDYGDFEKGLVRLECVEDIFGLPLSSYLAPVSTQWTDEVVAATVALSVVVQELPYYAIQTTFEQTVLDALLEGAAFVQAVAENPVGAAFNFKLATRQAADDYEEVADGTFAPTLQLVGALNRTDTTAIPVKNFRGGVGQIVIGGYAYIGTEAVRIDAVDLSAFTVDIGRGYLDTNPEPHSLDDVLYFADGNDGVSPNEYAVSDSVDVKVLPQSSLSVLPLADATERTVVMAGRRDRPYPAAQVRLNGAYFPATVESSAVRVSWTHQDRTQQLVAGGDDWYTISLSGPESGSTYKVEWYNDDTSTLLDSQSGVTVNFAKFTPAVTVGTTFNMRVEVTVISIGGDTSFNPYIFVFNYIKPFEFRILPNGDARILPNGDVRLMEN